MNNSSSLWFCWASCFTVFRISVFCSLSRQPSTGAQQLTVQVKPLTLIIHSEAFSPAPY